MSIHRKHLTHIASLILFIALNTLVYAQPGGGPGGGHAVVNRGTSQGDGVWHATNDSKYTDSTGNVKHP